MPGSSSFATLYIATSNPGKLRDFVSASSQRFRFLPLPHLDTIPPPVEDADTFTGNAVLKAIAYSLQAPGLIVLADDSGLEVDALHGAPGVYSARYAARTGFPNTGSLETDAWNNACLLHQLSGTPLSERNARYRCVLAAARDGALLEGKRDQAIGSGIVEGLILAEPRGKGSFGYDPLFYLPDRDQTMADINPAEKLKFSHRGRALVDLLTRLE